MTYELKPCPFCGGEGCISEKPSDRDGPEQFYGACSDYECGAKTRAADTVWRKDSEGLCRIDREATKMLTVEAWNRRAV